MFQYSSQELGQDSVHVCLTEREQTLHEPEVTSSPGGHQDEVGVCLCRFFWDS